MSQHQSLWQSFLKDIGLNSQQANGYQGYVINLNTLQQFGVTRKQIEASGAAMLEGALSPPTHARIALTRSPCQFQPMAGANDDFRLRANDCQDSSKALGVIAKWDLFKEEDDFFNAADYNNIGCAAMWITPQNIELARRMFEKAQKKESIAPEIKSNLKLLEAAREIPIRAVHVLEALQKSSYAPLLHWANDNIVMLGDIGHGEDL